MSGDITTLYRRIEASIRDFTDPAQPLRQPNQACPGHSGSLLRPRAHPKVHPPTRQTEPSSPGHGATQLTAGRSAQAHLSPLAEKHINGGDGGNLATPRSIDPLEVLAAGKARVCPAG